MEVGFALSSPVVHTAGGGGEKQLQDIIAAPQRGPKWKRVASKESWTCIINSINIMYTEIIIARI